MSELRTTTSEYYGPNSYYVRQVCRILLSWIIVLQYIEPHLRGVFGAISSGIQ